MMAKETAMTPQYKIIRLCYDSSFNSYKLTLVLNINPGFFRYFTTVTDNKTWICHSRLPHLCVCYKLDYHFITMNQSKQLPEYNSSVSLYT